MDFFSSTRDPHSFAIPELARVIDTNLELIVNFDRRILEGTATLTITRRPLINQIILDSLGLKIIHVTNAFDGTRLHHHVQFNLAFGSSLCVNLPLTSDTTGCIIKIKYETTPHSPALYWLTPAQTAYGRHPFLLSKNKLIYARTWFPCQDTPAVKFTYSAKISVEKCYRVLMSALSHRIERGMERDAYIFRQEQPVPSYAVVIAVGSLWIRKLNERTSIFAENYIFHSTYNDNFYTDTVIEEMLRYAELYLCGPYHWGRYDICLLPPSIADFEIECPCVTFISPFLISGDRSYVCNLLARNISQSWAGNLVTCENYQHLWLNKSFSLFISRKIKRHFLYHERIDVYLQKEGLQNMNSLFQKPKNVWDTQKYLRCLLPNLEYSSPDTATKYVPYERGYFLLCHLENILGGPTLFEPFLQSYFSVFACRSINTAVFKTYLYQQFPDRVALLDGVDWDSWFSNISSIPIMPELSGTSAWEESCFKLVESWMNWDSNNEIPETTDENNLCDVQKIILLKYLYSFHKSLTIIKLNSLNNRFFIQNEEIKFLWILLCIKVRWTDKLQLALDFATENCSPNYACPIFQHLYEWEEKHPIMIEEYNRKQEKMWYKTQKKIYKIIYPNIYL
ncbi:leukotriene A-4 hydrolase-like [Temnothorax curvispinosus]|uniref:Leukotriene A-4 hydrolase-like n=1 Tax=Temnothorax curvispinosus TaxID=300111 RepID=A0A6J1RD55_9HYME|nr:leukotriene A-4 hydrolase-like [Temnothorax curvispinosus]